MSELLNRVLKLADDAENFARSLSHSQPETIDGEFERVDSDKQALDHKLELQEKTMQTYRIVDDNDNVIDGFKNLSLAAA